MPQSFTPEQQAAVTHPPGPLLIVSGAGTGKTTTVVGRIQHQCRAGAWDPHHVVALTHSSKAAGHLQDSLRRIDSLLHPVRARTFHALALSILRTAAPPGLPTLTDSTFGVAAAALRACGVPDPDTAKIADALTAIGRAKSRLETPRSATAVPGLPVAMNALLKAYQKELDRRGQMDFTDVLTKATALLQDDSAAVREIRNAISHVLVDEYQDTDPAQQAFLDALLPDTRDLTAVGDPRQSIYAFKGAEPELLESFIQRYPGAETLTLSLDFRSTPQIVNAANALIPHPTAPLVAARQDGPDVRALSAFSEQDETQLVVTAVQKLLTRGVDHREIAVLVRFNAQTAAFESAFSQAGIPHVVLDGDRFFDRQEVTSVLKDAWNLMLAVETGVDYGIDLLPTESGKPQAPALPVLGLALAQAGFDPDLPPAGEGAARDRWEAQAALLSLVADLPDATALSARAVLTDLADRRAQAHTLATRAVTITTLHKAKGLEWDAVVIPRMVDGSLPSSRAKTPRELDEERRLAYVGITRAREHLVMTYSQRRGSSSRNWPAEPSPFLAQAGLAVEVDRSPKKRTDATSPTQKSRGSCSDCGAGLQWEVDQGLGRCREHLAAHEQATLMAILNFRAAYAAEKKLPEFAVFSDRAAGEIVRRSPIRGTQVASCGGIGARRAQEFGDTLVALIHRA